MHKVDIAILRQGMLFPGNLVGLYILVAEAAVLPAGAASYAVLTFVSYLLAAASLEAIDL